MFFVAVRWFLLVVLFFAVFLPVFAWGYVDEYPGCQRVLMLGDSITGQINSDVVPTAHGIGWQVQEAFNGLANVHIAASFQEALVDVLVGKTIKAALAKKVKVVTLAGGVACNSYLRKQMRQETEKHNVGLIFPSPVLCTDNAAMIACAGYYKYKKNSFSDFKLSPNPSLKL